jgi:hypothetical protein
VLSWSLTKVVKLAGYMSASHVSTMYLICNVYSRVLFFVCMIILEKQTVRKEVLLSEVLYIVSHLLYLPLY